MRKGIWVILLGVLLAAGILSDSYPKSWQSDSVNTSVQVTAPFQPQYTPNKNAQSSVNLAAELCGLSQFQKQYGTTGNKQRIALIDSGIDLGHMVFQTEEKEQPKVVIYRDYTEEGRLETQAAERYRNMLSAGGSVYRIGNIPNDVETYRLAFLDLNTVQPRFLTGKNEEMAVLVTARNSSGYNCVYLDTNRNCDFTDDTPLYLYEIQQQHLTLPADGGKLNLALTSISSDGRYLQFTADTLGHGTFLAGLMAGSGTD
ncbi:MAG: S8 family serine peptidase, partial [Peptococcaceae bacterium]|nr:S8 family serine peptidase [Peptococcaceae bacterium]